MKVPWLSKATISDAASWLRAEYQTTTFRPAAPPIPVEDIIERGLGLKLGFSDLRKKLKMDDVLGATYVNDKLICVDQSLVDNQNEGRLCFTFAHEAGHWVLHREFIDQACRTGNDEAYIFCRIIDAKKPVEWQADYFASCLLMPEKEVKRAFMDIFGSDPLVLYNEKSCFDGPICFDPCVQNWPIIAAAVKGAGGFSNVSKQAMIIRLQDLGLVKNKTHTRLTWEECLALF
jgi:Zn-dependent peptidase ImmA (M78 family)